MNNQYVSCVTCGEKNFGLENHDNIKKDYFCNVKCVQEFERRREILASTEIMKPDKTMMMSDINGRW